MNGSNSTDSFISAKSKSSTTASNNETTFFTATSVSSDSGKPSPTSPTSPSSASLSSPSLSASSSFCLTSQASQASNSDSNKSNNRYKSSQRNSTPNSRAQPNLNKSFSLQSPNHRNSNANQVGRTNGNRLNQNALSSNSAKPNHGNYHNRRSPHKSQNLNNFNNSNTSNNFDKANDDRTSNGSLSTHSRSDHSNHSQAKQDNLTVDNQKLNPTSSLPNKFKSNRNRTRKNNRNRSSNSNPQSNFVKQNKMSEATNNFDASNVENSESTSATETTNTYEEQTAVVAPAGTGDELTNNSSSASIENGQTSSSPAKPEPKTVHPSTQVSELKFHATTTLTNKPTGSNPIESMLLTENNRPIKKTYFFYVLKFSAVFAWLISIVWGLFVKSKRNLLPPIDDPLLLLPASELTARIKNRSLKCEQVIRAYINRIEQVQKYTNAVVDSCFDEAIQQAKSIDTQLKDPKLAQQLKAKPLLGVPFSCKDSIAVKGLAFTSGSWYRRNVKADEDAEVVANMRKAGAIPLVVTNTPEFVMWSETNNTVFGRANNPYDLTRTVGGSSGGEGALIASAGSLLGIGSDLGGSIRIPAFCNGIFGHKTTFDYCSINGMFPQVPECLHSFVCFGPMTRYATDLPLMFKAMSGGKADPLNLDQQVDLSKINFYYMLNDGGSPLTSMVDNRVYESVKKVISFFEKDYKTSARQVNFPRFMQGVGFFGAVSNYSEGPRFSEVVTCGEGKLNPFIEIVKFVLGKSKHTFATILLCFLEYLPSSINRQSEANKRSIDLMHELQAKFHKFLGDNSVLVFPPWPTLAPKHNQTYLRPFDVNYTTIFNAMSVPSTYCPIGLDPYSGLPLGVQIVAGPGQDRLCLSIAIELERKFGGWTQPS